jgi:hypothetical protein
MRVEQAIFTSIRGDRLDGYQLAAMSDGIDDELARRLTPWGPAHDSLLDPRPGAVSINFHPLDKQRFALSRTVRQGEEYSGRGGGRIFTNFFLLDREMLARFANQPLSILRALIAAGRTRIVEPLPKTLPSFPLVGRISAAETSGDDKASGEFDGQTLDMLVELVRSDTNVSVVCDQPADKWLRAIYARLTLDERLQLSFTTGLRPTASRRFLVSVVPDDPAQVRQSQRTGGTVVHLSPLALAGQA